ncbi:probable polygalacturonase At3g15720 isoform X1 [Ricinus communis]|uniref:probable polygalacturonase At3g15720 isoform X1 n=1 Tax=Ricinus communis TaxID=3988 RepID=UPI00201A67E1|nr:probable polygalacturonase At3g15720 isoform X1 [Ricinus communis]
MQGFFLATILVFCVATSNLVIADGRRNFNAAEFGAIGDGQTDNSEAFLKAWEAVCTATVRGTATLEIPAGTFLLNPVKFEGPCKSNKVHLQVLGKIVAPRTIDEWRPRCKSSVWLLFRGISGLIVNGPGAIDGRGSNWWKLGQTHGCKRPRALQFHNCNHVKLSGLTHMNSPKVHIGVNGCKGVSISNLNISAPEDSPNTDGIGISGSTDVHISNSTIGTGDDCIAVNGGCSHINITNVTCGPGHGISVGSLGDKGCNDKVEDVHVQNCTFIGTQNGVRIKTWPGGSGYAKNISFERIVLHQTKNPIIIDQHYCNGHKCTEKAVAVELSGIKYSGVEGTSASKQAITFDCAKIGCRNIAMDQINITSSSPGKQIHAFCNNAKGTSTSTTPLVPCLLSL